MPHFRLMDEKALGPEAAALMRARLHIRGGKRRLRQGKIKAGFYALYDALLSAMDWNVASPDRLKTLLMPQGFDFENDEALFTLLKRSGMVDGTFDYEGFKRLVYGPLPDETAGYDYTETLEGFESVMRQLGVMPFDESALPAEDPSTY
jgi:hypothetical protein